MAKTFKKPAASAEQSKPISERDFFDLTDEPLSQVTTDQAVGNNNNSGNTSNKKGTIEVVATGETPRTNSQKAPVPDAEPEERDVRQTFVVSGSQLEQLRDFVHARKVQGDYEYSQKQALQEALDLLFASADPVAPRPAHTRAQEQQRRQRIQRGRRTGAAD